MTGHAAYTSLTRYRSGTRRLLEVFLTRRDLGRHLLAVPHEFQEKPALLLVEYAARNSPHFVCAMKKLDGEILILHVA
jgi:hypothetical protein